METGRLMESYEDYVRSGRFAFHILPELYRPDKGYQAVTAVEGLTGFYQSNLFCGHDYEIARWYAQRKNEEMGINAKTATEIINGAFAMTPLQPWNRLPI
jgi:hypothetical protein